MLLAVMVVMGCGLQGVPMRVRCALIKQRVATERQVVLRLLGVPSCRALFALQQSPGDLHCAEEPSSSTHAAGQGRNSRWLVVRCTR